MNASRNVYPVKVSLAGDKRTYREIEILGTQNLDQLHTIIFKAFDRFDPHLYSFYLTRTKTTSRRKIYDAPKYRHSQAVNPVMSGDRTEEYDARETTMDSLGLTPGMVFYYLFDFGDEWWHEITVKSIEPETEKKRYPRITVVHGESPEQYPEMEEMEEE